MVLLRKQTTAGVTYERGTFDLVRFNVDVEPDSPPSIMPVVSDDNKVFERIWIVDQVPFEKQFFGRVKHDSI